MASLSEHAEDIRDAIRLALADGYAVGVSNQCCGCSEMTLQIATNRSDVILGRGTVIEADDEEFEREED